MNFINDLGLGREHVHRHRVALLATLLEHIELPLRFVFHRLHQCRHVRMQLDLDQLIVHGLVNLLVEHVLLPLEQRLVDVEGPLPIRDVFLVLLDQLHFSAYHDVVPLLRVIEAVYLLALFELLYCHEVGEGHVVTVPELRLLLEEWLPLKQFDEVLLLPRRPSHRLLLQNQFVSGELQKVQESLPDVPLYLLFLAHDEHLSEAVVSLVRVGAGGVLPHIIHTAIPATPAARKGTTRRLFAVECQLPRFTI